MIQVQSVRQVNLEPQSFTNGAIATLLVDTLAGGGDQYQYATFFINLGRTNTATNVPSVLKLQSSDTTVAATFTDVSGGSFTTGFTTGQTAGGDNLLLGVNTAIGKRYLQLLISPTTTQLVAATCVLSRPQASPWTTAMYNVSAPPIFLTQA